MMNRKKINTIAIVSLSVISAAGIFYYIYLKAKVKRLNEQVKTVDELRQQIEALDVPDGPIEPEPVDPDSQSSMEFDDNGNPIDPVQKFANTNVNTTDTTSYLNSYDYYSY